MTKTTEIPALIDLTPARRCPDYDDDCKFVKDHVACATGCTQMVAGILCTTPPIDGYCPFVIGMR